MSEYEEVLKSVGSFGPYQIRVFVLVNAVEIALAWAVLLPVLVSPSTKWKCASPKDVWNLTTDVNVTLLTNHTPADFKANKCSMDGNVCSKIEFVDDYTTIISEWNLVCDMDYVADLAISMNMIGSMIGVMVGGQLADTFGRRYVLYGQYLLLVIFSFGTAFTQTWIDYVILRFIVGWLYGGVGIGTRFLPMEFITPRWRSFCNCIGFWGLASGLLGVWGYFIRDWRHVIIATSVCSAPLFLTFWIIPESPRWLLKKGKIEEAKKIITALAKFNKKPTPDFSSLQSFVKRETNAEEARKKFGYWHLFNTKTRLVSSLILIYLQFACASVYLGIIFNVTNLSGDRYLNIFLMGIVDIPGNFFTMFVANKFGRRKTVSLLYLVSGVCLMSILVMNLAGKMEEYYVLLQTFAFIGKGSIAGGCDALNLLAIETYPTIIRPLME